MSAAEAEAAVRVLVVSWCDGTSGPRRLERAPRHIMTMVMKQGTLMALTGLALGLGGAAATVRYLGTFLFGLTPLDPMTFAGVGAALLMLALVACAIPAWRAAKIDAIHALRK